MRRSVLRSLTSLSLAIITSAIASIVVAGSGGCVGEPPPLPEPPELASATSNGDAGGSSGTDHPDEPPARSPADLGDDGRGHPAEYPVSPHSSDGGGETGNGTGDECSHECGLSAGHECVPGAGCTILACIYETLSGHWSEYAACLAETACDTELSNAECAVDCYADLSTQADLGSCEIPGETWCLVECGVLEPGA